MVKLEEHKHTTEHKPIESLPLPKRVNLALSQHIGKPCVAKVLVGDEVSVGQRIAQAEANVYAPIHASIAGKVVAVGEWAHPLAGRFPAITIEGDGSERAVTFTKRSKELVAKLTADEIRKIVFEAGIVGMGGASFPTHIKLTPPKPIDTLIINGAECEPYLTSDNRLMIEKAPEIVQGIELVQRSTGAKNVVVAIEENKPEAIKVLQNSIRNTQYSLRILESSYPQGGEKQLVKNVLRKEVPQGKLPFDIGVVIQNVATVYAIYEAVYLGKPLFERVVTVTGDCIERPGNFLIRLGTSVQDIYAACGPVKKEPAKIIFGGPMMGVAQYSFDTPIIKSTNGIIFSSESVAPSVQACECVRCGRCVQYCPVGLEPCLIAQASEKQMWDIAKSYGCLDCMECGLCSYTCPQKINLVQLIKFAKTRLPK